MHPRLDYVIPGQFGNTSSGNYNYHRRLFGSTHTTLNRANPDPNPHSAGLPSAVWRDWTTRIPGMTTLGASDAAVGRNVYELRKTTMYVDTGYELLIAWAGRNLNTSLGVGSTVRLG